MSETFVSGPGMPEQMPAERGTWLLRAYWHGIKIHDWELPWRISASTEETRLEDWERNIFAGTCGATVDDDLDYYLAFEPAPAR